MMNILSIRYKLILTVLAAFAINTSFACMCVNLGSFEEFATLHPIIVRGSVREYGEALPNGSGYFNTMTIEVSETIKGDFPHLVFQFYGDTGMSCLRYITAEDYPLGSEHLFILESGNSLQPLMVCGESSVRIVGTTVRGHTLDENGYQIYEKALEEVLNQVR